MKTVYLSLYIHNLYTNVRIIHQTNICQLSMRDATLYIAFYTCNYMYLYMNMYVSPNHLDYRSMYS